jgi:uncharacterized protein
MEILRAIDYRQVRWKNGGGLTREVFVQWNDANQTAWDWRISMADVLASGPFSQFPGIDRSIAVLEGRGLRLTFPPEQAVILDLSSQPFAFAGEADVMCEAIRGPTLDLNVMTLRKAFRHSLRKFHCTQTTTYDLETGWNALVANTALAIYDKGRQFGLQRLDAAVDIESSIEITPVIKGDVYLLNVSAV